MQESRLEKERLSEERQMENILNKIVVQQALGQLPEELQEMIILYYFQWLKLTEMSEILHIGLQVVKYRWRRAKNQLEKWL